MNRFLPALFFVSALAGSTPALATPITFTQTSVASGSIGLTPFANATVTFTQITDTSLTSGTSQYLNTGGLRTVTISGVGTASFLSPTIGFSSTPFAQGVVFGDESTGYAFGGTNSAYANYNLAGSIGPITDTSTVLSVSYATSTSLGSFYVYQTSSPTFQATLTPGATPEIDPSGAAACLALVAGGIAVLRGRRFRPRSTAKFL